MPFAVAEENVAHEAFEHGADAMWLVLHNLLKETGLISKKEITNAKQ